MAARSEQQQIGKGEPAAQTRDQRMGFEISIFISQFGASPRARWRSRNTYVRNECFTSRSELNTFRYVSFSPVMTPSLTALS